MPPPAFFLRRFEKSEKWAFVCEKTVRIIHFTFVFMV